MSSKDYSCVICSSSFSKLEEKITICGGRDPICPTCTDLGWISPKRTGGPIEYHNSKTGQTLTPKRVPGYF